MANSDSKGGTGKPDAHAETAISSPDARAESKPVSAVANDPMVGRTIVDRYKVLSLLGRGGMGSVYIAEHVQLKKRVALKVLSEGLNEQAELVARFLKEARAAAQIGHPNIVEVFDLDALPEGGAFIAMALLEGHDLQAELDKGGAVVPARARVIVSEICRALSSAHAKGIVHRDMKPANVFLARDADGREQVKVLDFGIAQVQDSSGEDARLTQTGAIVGTPAFMSPEQARGERPDHRADIYSVGCILFTLLTGEPPFFASTLMGVLAKHLMEAPDPPSKRRPHGTIDAELDAIVLRALAKQPDDRFQTMKELWLALEGQGESSVSFPESSSQRYVVFPPNVLVAPTGSQPPRASRAGLWVGLVVLVAALGGTGFFFFHKAQVPPVATVAPAVPVLPAPAAVSFVTLEIRSTPKGATVWEGDKNIGVTPLELVRRHSTTELALKLTSEGNLDETLSIPLEHDQLVDIRLRPKAVEPVVEKPRNVDRTVAPTHKTVDPKKTGRTGELKDPFAQ